MHRFNIFTVPHTGTHFIFKFVNDVLGAERDNGPAHYTKDGAYYWPFHAFHQPLHMMSPRIQSFCNGTNNESRRPTLVTARDPYLSTIHYMDLAPTRKLSDCAGYWDTFLGIIPRTNHFIVDIGCHENKRTEHLCEVADFLRLPYKLDDMKTFAEAWKPENARSNDMKKKYLETGTLPDPRGESWDMLDNAVAWYKSLPTNGYS